ncbi:XPG domain containing-domain-containing protein [Geopyxis carbonaria]|nr:XPG domain containing-domain-containing protein [Geopyxis carbonaria]
MGIRGLYTHLQPHSGAETFSASTPTAVAIDGPALVYHVYALTFSASARGSNAFDTAVPYTTLADAVVAFLDQLVECGLVVEKIYFDGALPAGKTPTRAARLDESLRKLAAYRNANQNLYTPASFRPGAAAAATTQTHTQQLPAPPFIVYAALTVLAAHAVYGARTHTVPGEADPFLAAAGVLVLTGDSDLLVFTPPPVGVLMFRDLCLPATGTGVATGRVFRPAAMAAALGHPLLNIAYEIVRDPTAPSLAIILARLGRVATRAKAGVGGDGVPAEFAAEYTLPAVPVDPNVRVVEPRISELLHQPRTADAGERCMYLPFLPEDPQRASAWTVCTELRAHAYSLLFPAATDVLEIHRRGPRIASSPIAATPLPSPAALDALVPHILTSILTATTSIESKTLAAIAATLGVGAGGRETARGERRRRKNWSWSHVHTFAQVCAGWYSLLLLREAMLATAAGGDVALVVPDVPDGQRFLEALEEPGKEARRVAAEVMAQAQVAEEVAEADAEAEEAAMVMKRGHDAEGDKDRTRSAKKKKRKKSAAGVEGVEVEVVVAGSRFAVLEVE